MAKNVVLRDYYCHGEMKSFLLMSANSWTICIETLCNNYEPQAAILQWGLLVYWIHRLPNFSIL
jgi:hypothetical protein